MPSRGATDSEASCRHEGTTTRTAAGIIYVDLRHVAPSVRIEFAVVGADVSLLTTQLNLLQPSPRELEGRRSPTELEGGDATSPKELEGGYEDETQRVQRSSRVDTRTRRNESKGARRSKEDETQPVQGNSIFACTGGMTRVLGRHGRQKQSNIPMRCDDDSQSVGRWMSAAPSTDTVCKRMEATGGRQGLHAVKHKTTTQTNVSARKTATMKKSNDH
jgi:hypothetical protein